MTERPAGTLVSINVSRGGVPKRPVPEATVTADGLLGDRQADRRHHGGAERAVTLFSRERIDRLRAEGHPIDVGTTGENLTVAGLDWDAVQPPVRVRVGAVELQVTKFASPCEKIAASFKDADFLRLSEQRHPGWSRVCAKVLREGLVHAGDAVELLGVSGQGSGRLA